MPFMKKLKTSALLLSAVMGLSINNFDREPVNPNTLNQIFNRFRNAPLSVITYPKVAYENGFYKDYFIEEDFLTFSGRELVLNGHPNVKSQIKWAEKIEKIIREKNWLS